MSFAKYYGDELAWLREMGAELSAARPELGAYLKEPGSDPDVERLLEGFAFLTGRIREKLDDEFPEVTHGLMDMFCPQYLRPIPSMAIVQVRPKPNVRVSGTTSVPRGTYIDSRPIDGTRCRYRTVSDLELAPVSLADVSFDQGHTSTLRLRFEPRADRSVRELEGKALSLHLTGDRPVTRALFVALCRYVTGTRVVRSGTSQEVRLEFSAGGLDERDAALPVPERAFAGFRLLQEYFAFPERFGFVDIAGLEAVGDGRFELEIDFRELPDGMPTIGPRHVLLDCVAAINLFAHDGDPIRAEDGRSEYRLRPSGKEPSHYEVYSVDSVVGHLRHDSQARTFRPYFGFDPQDRAGGSAGNDFYELRRRGSLRGMGSDLFVRLSGEMSGREQGLDTLSVGFTCTNRDLPTRIGPGDLCEPHPEAPHAFVYENVTSPSAPVPAPVGDEVHWRLLAQLTTNLSRLADRNTLCTALSLYDFRARVDRQARRRLESFLDGIQDVKAVPEVDLLEGIPVRGVRVTVELQESKLGGEGEACLFGGLLAEFLVQFVSLNSFVRLQLNCSERGEVFEWPGRIGTRITL